MKILIVEDDQVCNNLLKAILEAEGHGVITSTNGIEALTLMEQKEIEAIRVRSDVLVPLSSSLRRDNWDCNILDRIDGA